MRNNTIRQRVIGAFLGTIVEYYDYSLYGFSAGIIAQKFFDTKDHLANLTSVFAIYAVAYISKPVGSLLFGRLGDLYGRKIALSITIIGIALPTTIIGLLPDYSQLGITSVIILSICRLVQGVFVAGEYDGAAIYVIEHLGTKYHYTASALTRSAGVLGLLLGIGATNLFNSHIFPDWGWRLPFLLSLPLAVITIYYRRNFDETPEFKIAMEHKIKPPKFSSLIRKQWRIILLVIFSAGGFGATYQISIIFMKQYLPIVLPQSVFIMSTFSIILVMCFGMAMPVAGIIADRLGREFVIKFSLIFSLLSALFLSISIYNQILNLALASCVMLAISVAPFNGLAHGIIIKAFPVSERYRAISLGHTLGSMLMSGSANYICLVFMNKFNYRLFPIFYITIFIILSYFTIKQFDKKLS